MKQYEENYNLLSIDRTVPELNLCIYSLTNLIIYGVGAIGICAL